MVERFPASFGRLDKNPHIFLDLLLANVVIKGAGTQGNLHLGVLRDVIGRHDPVFKVHLIVKHRSFVPFSSGSQPRDLFQCLPDQLIHRQVCGKPCQRFRSL